MKLFHAVRQFTAQLIDARHESFEMVAILNPRSLSYFLNTFALQTDWIRTQNRIIVISGQLSRAVADLARRFTPCPEVLEVPGLLHCHLERNAVEPKDLAHNEMSLTYFLLSFP